MICTKNQSEPYTMMKYALTVLALTASASAADPVLFGDGHRVGVVQGVEVSSDQRSSFRDFKRETGYFGAFYIDRSSDYSFWVQNFHNLGTAKDVGLKGCQIVSGGGNCALYAVVVPKGMDLATPTAQGLSQEAYSEYTGAYRTRQTEGRYGAIAVSGAAEVGVSWNWQNEAEARATAIAYCEKEVAAELAELNIEGRAWVKRRGLDTCRVVESTQG